MWLSILTYLHLLVYHKRITPLPYLISMKISYVYLCHENGKQQLYPILVNTTTVYRTSIYIKCALSFLTISQKLHHSPTHTSIFTKRRFLTHKTHIHFFKLIKYWRLKPAAVTQCHVPEDLSLQQHFYGSLKISHNVLLKKNSFAERFLHIPWCEQSSNKVIKGKTFTSSPLQQRKQFPMGCWKST